MHATLDPVVQCTHTVALHQCLMLLLYLKHAVGGQNIVSFWFCLFEGLHVIIIDRISALSTKVCAQ